MPRSPRKASSRKRKKSPRGYSRDWGYYLPTASGKSSGKAHGSAALSPPPLPSAWMSTWTYPGAPRSQVSRRTDSQSTTQSATKSASDLPTDCEEFKQQITKLEKTIGELLRRSRSSGEELRACKEVEQSNVNLRIIFDRVTQELRDARARLAQVPQGPPQASLVEAQLRDQIERLTRRVEALSGRPANCDQQVNDRDAALAGLRDAEGRLMEAQRRSAESAAQIEAAKRDMAALQDELRMLQGEKGDCARAREECLKELNAVRGDLARLEGEQKEHVDEKDARIEEVQAQLREQIEQLTGQIEVLSGRPANCDQQTKDRDEALADLNDAKNLLLDEQRRSAGLSEQIEVAKKEVAHLEQELARLRALGGEEDERAQAHGDCARELADARANLGNLEAERQDSIVEKNALSKQVTDLGNDLRGCRESQAARLEKLGQCNRELRECNKKTEEALGELKVQNEQSEARLASARSKLQNMLRRDPLGEGVQGDLLPQFAAQQAHLIDLMVICAQVLNVLAEDTRVDVSEMESTLNELSITLSNPDAPNRKLAVTTAIETIQKQAYELRESDSGKYLLEVLKRLLETFTASTDTFDALNRGRQEQLTKLQELKDCCEERNTVRKELDALQNQLNHPPPPPPVPQAEVEVVVEDAPALQAAVRDSEAQPRNLNQGIFALDNFRQALYGERTTMDTEYEERKKDGSSSELQQARREYSRAYYDFMIQSIDSWKEDLGVSQVATVRVGNMGAALAAKQKAVNDKWTTYVKYICESRDEINGLKRPKR